MAEEGTGKLALTAGPPWSTGTMPGASLPSLSALETGMLKVEEVQIHKETYVYTRKRMCIPLHILHIPLHIFCSHISAFSLCS